MMWKDEGYMASGEKLISPSLNGLVMRPKHSVMYPKRSVLRPKRSVMRPKRSMMLLERLVMCL